MNTTALYQRPQWIIIGTVMVAAVIGGSLRLFSTQEAPVAEDMPEQTEQAAGSNETTPLFESPIVSLSTQIRAAASPADLLLSTSSRDRLSVVSAGRPDPFAPVTRSTGPIRSAKARSNEPAPASTAVANPGIPQALPPVPVGNPAGLPPVPVVSAPPQPVPLPAIPVATSPITIPALPSSLPQASPVPQDPVQAIELTGVVQVGDRVGIIVREGQGSTSRHIFVGDRLAGGQVHVKSIDLSASEPVIILEYQGREYPRVVG